jgi:molecular chaperone DnaK (HSP70)
MSASDPVIGIDLGTTNSEVAIIRDGAVVIVEDHGNPILPSVVSLSRDGRVVVGQEARNLYILHPDRTVKSIKRKMGSAETVTMADHVFRPQEISAMILRELKTRAETALGQPVTKAVITVPAYFNDAQRAATREAGAIAGLDVLRIINEPTAACLAYENNAGAVHKTVLAFDLGGGTFDVSIVKMDADLVEVIASHGDNHLGGDDFDELLLNRLVTHYYETHDKKDGALTGRSLNRLRHAAEAAKIHLSAAASSKIVEDHLETTSGERTSSLSLEITRADLEALIEPLVNKTLASVHQALALAKLAPAAIDEIVLVGGATRTPMIRDLLEARLGKRPRTDVHPDLAVAYGAGVMAARLMGESHHRILIDITPYTFGVSCLGYQGGRLDRHCFEAVIKAGSPLPASAGKVFYTVVDGQDAVNVNIFQGEHRDCRQNIPIGQFTIGDLDPDAPDNSPILLNMNLDINGILAVTAIEQSSGKACSIAIENALKELNPEQLTAAREKLAALYPDDALAGPDDDNDENDDGDVNDDEAESGGATPDAIPRPAPETPIDAQFLQRIETLKPHMDAVDLQDLTKAMARLQRAGNVNDADAIANARREIEDILFYVEGNA